MTKQRFLGRWQSWLTPLLLVLVIVGISSVSWAVTPQLTAGASHSLVVKSDGSLWAAGLNQSGQLGDGTAINQSTPVQIAGKWRTASAGLNHSLAIRADGTLWSWGSNQLGQLGLPLVAGQLAADRLAPVQIGADTKWIAVVAAGFASYGLKADGTLWAWGANDSGQLGDGTIVNKTEPVQVLVAAFSNGSYVAIASGGEHALALQADGTLWAWGFNVNGELGLGTADPNPHPTPVQVGLDSDWAVIGAGDTHSVAIKANGTLWAWGRNNVGQVGNGAVLPGADLLAPTQITGTGDDNTWAALATGELHTVALKRNGSIWGWGANVTGQLGDGSTTTRAVPTLLTAPAAIAGNMIAVAAGGGHSLALKANGEIYGWGDNGVGQLGNGTLVSSLAPLKTSSDAVSWVGTEPGFVFSTALRADGTLWAWGDNASGQLGDGSNALSATPKEIGTASNWLASASGDAHTVAIRADGTLWSWGENFDGQLGDGNAANNSTPAQITVTNPVSAVPHEWAAVAAGSFHSVALKADGTLWVWGSNLSGQLGDPAFGASTNVPQQLLISGIGVINDQWVAIAAGGSHTLAIRADGTLWVWGSNLSGQLGDPLLVDPLNKTPQQLVVSPAPAGGATSFNSNWKAVAAGLDHSLALQADGTVWAWGANNLGQIGNGATLPGANVTSPTKTAVTNAVSVTAGDSHSYALKADGTLWSWGQNANGQLGINSLVDSSTPQQVTTTSPVSAVNDWASFGAGGNHMVGLKNDGTIWTWGANANSQLGDGLTVDKLIPTALVEARLALSTTSIAFGSAAIGFTAPTRTFTLSNTGTAPLAATIVSNNAPAFSVSPASCNIAAGGAPCTVTVTFTPTGPAGPKAATLTIASNDPITPVSSLAVTGTAVNAFIVTSSIDPASPASSGTISPLGAQPVVPGNNITFAIAANAGFALQNVTVDGVPQGPVASYTFANVQASHTIVATFANAVTITATAGAGGSINPAGSVAVATGSDQSFTFTPNAGFAVADVLVDSVSVLNLLADSGLNKTFTFNNVTANHTIAVTFAAKPITTWNWRNPLPQGVAIKNIATDGAGNYVAVGDYGTIMTSTDSVAWTVRESGATGLNGVVFGGSKYVAVGNGGRILLSTDNGTSWTAQSSGIAVALNAVTYTGTTFVAVGNTFSNPNPPFEPRVTILTSTNGTTWTTRFQPLPLNTTSDLWSVVANGATVAAGGEGGLIMTSADHGTTWSTVAADLVNRPENIYGLTYGSATFVAVGANGQITSSTDNGVSWNPQSAFTLANLFGVGYGTIPDPLFSGSTVSVFVAVGTDGELLTSEDGGVSWTNQVSGLSNNGGGPSLFAAVVGRNGGPAGINILLVAGEFGYLLASADEFDWTSRMTAATQLNLTSAVRGNGVFVAVGGTKPGIKSAAIPVIVSSADNGLTWTRQSVAAARELTGVAYGNGIFVAVGKNAQGGQAVIMTSSDGVSWTSRVSGTPLGLNGVAFVAGNFVAVGDYNPTGVPATEGAVILTSANGIAWTAQRQVTSTAGAIYAVAEGTNGSTPALVAIGEFGTVLISTNEGTSWSEVIDFVINGADLTSVAFNRTNNTYAVSAIASEIFTSNNNGATWTARLLPIPNTLNVMTRGIAYNYGRFVAVGNDNFILTSPDGAAWSVNMGAEFINQSLNSVVSGNGTFVAVGGNGAILQSNLLQSPLPQISVAPASMAFGVIQVGNSSPSQILTITNKGAAPLIIGTLALAGINPTDFVLSSNACSGATLAPAATCTVNVTFAPAVAGAKSARLEVPSNDPDSPVVGIVLTGNAAQPPVTTANPPAGTYIAQLSVTLTANVPATIRYTIDNSDPKTSPTTVVYSGPINIVSTTTIKYFATDLAGNAENVQTGVYIIHTPDLVASVLINGGASVTRNPAVTLTLNATDATGVTKMRFSNDNITYTADEIYATSKAWTLSNGDGLKTVYVRFTDGAGILYEPVTAQITLDTTAPITTASPTAGTFIAPFSVTLTTNEPATIRYTADGSNPTTSGTAVTYTGPIAIAATTTLKYFATDLAGNAEAVNTGLYTIHQADLVASVLINGGAAYTNSTAVTLTLAATDATGVTSMRFSNDGVTYTPDEPYATSKAWTLTSGDGIKTVFVRFTDGAGMLYDPVVALITLDTVKPVTTAFPPSGTYITAINVVLTTNEPATIRYTLDGSEPTTSPTAVVYSGPISIAATTTVKYFATDRADNEEVVKTRIYTIHAADLVASVQINGGAQYTKTTAVTLSLSATDATGVTKMRFSNDGINYTADEPYATSKAWALTSGDGVKIVFVRFTDGAGLLYDPVIAQITLDTLAPTTVSIPAAGNFIAPFSVTLTANEPATIKYTRDGSDPTTSGTAVTYTGPIAIAATTTLKYFATDLAGNAEAVKTGLYTIHQPDLVASVLINGGAAYTNSTAVTLTLAATDAADGVTSMRFSNDGVTYTADEPYATSKAWTLTSGDGIKTVYVRFTDGAGLLYDPVVALITLDTVTPVTTAFPPTGTYITAINAVLTASEPATIRYTLDGSEPTTSLTTLVYGGPISIAATTTVKYFATDRADNKEVVKTSTYTIHAADLVASVQINGGAQYAKTTAVTLALSATDATGVIKMRFSNDGINYTADEDYATSKAWTLTSGDGVKTVFVRFTDGAGLLYDPVIAQITLDTQAPSTISIPAAATFLAPISVSLVADEAATIRYTVDGSDPVTSTTAATYSSAIAVASTTTLKYFATDLAGNAEAVKTGVFTIHTADLTASIAINGGAATTTNSVVTLTLAASDPAGVSKMRFSNDGVTYTADEAYATSKTWTLTSGDGPKTVFVRFTDNLNNLYDPVVAQIKLDTTVPVTTAAPAGGNFISAITVSLIANEAATIRYTLDGSDPTPASTVYSSPLTISASTTLKYFATDVAGNAEAFKTAVYNVHTADLTGSIKINNGSTLTNKNAVTLTLSATDPGGVTKMRFSNDGITYTADEAYATSKSWTLSSGDGVKTVFVRFTDGGNNLYDPMAAQITLDTSIKPDGKVLGGTSLTIADALRVLQIYQGLVVPTATDLLRGDVAPLVNGKPAPDGFVDIRDVVIILRAFMGLVTL